MVESHSARVTFLETWQGLGRLLAVASGAGTALLSIASGVALPGACLRGGTILMSALLVTWIGGIALARSWSAGSTRVEASIDGSRSEK